MFCSSRCRGWQEWRWAKGQGNLTITLSDVGIAHVYKHMCFWCRHSIQNSMKTTVWECKRLLLRRLVIPSSAQLPLVELPLLVIPSVLNTEAEGHGLTWKNELQEGPLGFVRAAWVHCRGQHCRSILPASRQLPWWLSYDNISLQSC